MVSKLKSIYIPGVFLLALSGGISAGNNPINEAYVQLSAADWAAACTSGSPTAVAGCLGDVGSPKFAKINRLLGWPTDFANIPIVSAPNSVFILQYGGNSAVPFPSASRNAVINVPSSIQGGVVHCALFTSHGNPSGWSGTMAGQTGIGANPQQNSGGMNSIARGESIGAHTGDDACSLNHATNGICFAESNDPSGVIVLPQYLLCLGATSGGAANQPASLAGITAQ